MEKILAVDIRLSGKGMHLVVDMDLVEDMPQTEDRPQSVQDIHLAEDTIADTAADTVMYFAH